MKTCRIFAGHKRSHDSGFTLVEVMVAMMVFAVVATAIAYSLTSVLALSSDNRARVVATNLASQEVDHSRDIADLFDLGPRTHTVDVDGNTYTIERETAWVSDPTIDQKCGAGGGVLRYKRVNVKVSWTGMRSATPVVRADTLIDPGTKLNDPALGTILVSVTGAVSGLPISGVTVSAGPSAAPNGATAITTPAEATDVQGCSYLLRVTPGNYDVSVTKSGYVDIEQSPTSTITVGVAAGSAVPAGLQLDQAGVFSVTYPAAPANLPVNLDTSFLSTYPIYTTTAPASPVLLSPLSLGYQALAGKYVDPTSPTDGCKAVDPENWLAGAIGATSYSAGKRQSAAGAVPGGAGELTVSMGLVTISSLTKNQYITAVEQSTGPTGTANPGCLVPVTYKFSQNAGTTRTIALPFGSWKLYTGTSSGSTSSAIAIGRMTLSPLGQLATSGNIITIDPRLVAP